MGEPIEVRSGGHLLFIVSRNGKIECLRDGWLHTVDIVETLRTGTPVVERRYVGKKLLTKVPLRDSIASN